MVHISAKPPHTRDSAALSSSSSSQPPRHLLSRSLSPPTLAPLRTAPKPPRTMVSCKTLAAAAAAAALASLPLSSAWITAMTAPSEATAGSAINATFTTAIFIQNWVDYGIIFGLAPTSSDCSSCVGTEVGFVTLDGTEGAAYPYTFDESVTIPAGTSAGDYYLKAAIPHLVGVSG